MRAPLLLSLLGLTLWFSASLAEAGIGGWSPNRQYHIQTDEGPERYFRYQTSNGQYRKEKRLADGTVIGTEGWLDPLGYLRLKDYIADENGYRILKSKMVYVGVDGPKDVAPQAGVLVEPVRPPNPFRDPTETLGSNEILPIAYHQRGHPSPPIVPSAGNPRDIHVRRGYNPGYDGTYTVANGFQYYLKRQYHEEERQPSSSVANNGVVGSFGYIDPFGIRRVIYYKTDPATGGGFVHRKNNRYVGFEATPYDPTLSNLQRRRAARNATATTTTTTRT